MDAGVRTLSRRALGWIGAGSILAATLGAQERWVVGSRTFDDVRVREVTPGEVTIFHADGIAQLDLATLPAELRARFDFDPARAATWRAAVAEERRALAQAQGEILARRAAQAAAPEPADPAERAPARVQLHREVDLRPRYADYGLIFKDQGRRPSCSIFALVSAVEFEYARAQGRAETLSEEFLLWAVRELHPGIATDNGFHFREVVSALQAFGIPRQSSMPNTFGIPVERIQPSPGAVAEAAARRDLVPVWYRTDGDEVLPRIVQALNAGTPVVVGLRWPHWRTLEGNHLLARQQPRDGPGHAVTLVGYRCTDGNPASLVFTFRNSYGVDWGVGGCGFVAAAYLKANLLGAFHLTTPARIATAGSD